MSKKFKGKTCVYCAVPGASETGDHVFAREFFLPDQRAELPKVPACGPCNSAKSELEHYLTAVLPFASNHPHSSHLLRERVPERLANNRRLHRALAAGAATVELGKLDGAREAFALPFDSEHLMDEGGALLVNLSKGQLGEDSASVLGSFLVSIVGLAALSRADAPPAKRRPFFLYVDEFQTFTTLAFANMMAELRKYGLGLTLAHQHLHQLDPEVRHAVLGNAGTLMAFRVGAEDAPLLAQEFQPTFDVQDLINLPNRHFYLKLMIDGSPSRPFSARTMDLP